MSAPVQDAATAAAPASDARLMLNNLQALRAVAALLVVFVHLSLLNAPLLGQWLRVGLYGVDLFFVISGFVMVYTTIERPQTPRQFFVNRIIRIVPLYWALTLALAAVALVMPSLLHSITFSWDGLVRSLFFIPYETEAGLLPLLPVGWTLNYEMFFYAIFALGLLIGDVRRRVIAVMAVLAALVLVGFALRPSSPVLNFYTSPLLLEFAYGMLLGLAYPRLRGLRMPAALAVGLAALAALWMYAVSLYLPEPGAWQALVHGVPAAVIVAMALRLELTGRATRSRFLLLLGAASYALYLVHYLVYGALRVVVARLQLDQGVALAMSFLAGLAAMIAAALTVHLLYERPVDRLLRRRSRSAGRPGAVSDEVALWPWRRRIPNKR